MVEVIGHSEAKGGKRGRNGEMEGWRGEGV